MKASEDLFLLKNTSVKIRSKFEREFIVTIPNSFAGLMCNLVFTAEQLIRTTYILLVEIF